MAAAALVATGCAARYALSLSEPPSTCKAVPVDKSRSEVTTAPTEAEDGENHIAVSHRGAGESKTKMR